MTQEQAALMIEVLRGLRTRLDDILDMLPDIIDRI